jgi:hypothetical protein
MIGLAKKEHAIVRKFEGARIIDFVGLLGNSALQSAAFKCTDRSAFAEFGRTYGPISARLSLCNIFQRSAIEK